MLDCKYENKSDHFLSDSSCEMLSGMVNVSIILAKSVLNFFSGILFVVCVSDAKIVIKLK
jgi:hypothetical protein